ncbi:MAG: hypothetical protein R3F61_28260 [Myxococcota bacterium]
MSLLALVVLSGAASAKTFKFSDADTDEIVGEVQKPDVTVVISRENLNKAYELELDESFLQKIVDSVESEPF